MNESRYAFAAGLFIIAMIALALFIIVSSADPAQIFQTRVGQTVVFASGNDVKGLNNRSDVRVFGVKVGQVDRVDLIPARDGGPAEVRVSFHLPEAYQLRQGAAVQVQTGLTGGSLLNITDLGDGAPLAPGEAVRAETYGFDQILAELRETIPQIKETLANFKQAGARATVLIDHVNEKIDPVVERYNVLVDTGTDVLKDVKDILGDTKVDIRTAIVNIKDAITTIKERSPTLFDKAEGAMDSAKAALDKARGAVEKLDPSIDNAKVITTNLRQAVTENRHKIDQVMNSLKRAAANLEGGIADIRRAPWRLLNKPDKVDERNLAVYAAARDFAYAAQGIEAAAAALQVATQDPDFDIARIERMQLELDERIARFNRIQDQIWREFQFNSNAP